MRWNPRLLILLLAFGVGGGGLTSCNVGNAPVRAGGSWLRFGTYDLDPAGGGRVPVIRLELFAGSPFFHWDFRDWQLVGNRLPNASTSFDLTLRTLGGQLPTTFARYNSSHAFWKLVPGASVERELWTQHEVLLFARDPTEQARHFRSFVGASDFNNASFPARWRSEWTSELIPDAATIWYPPYAGFVPPDAVIDGTPVTLLSPSVTVALDSSQFWGTNVTPAGPGAAPDCAGSVKAVKVVNHGMCGASIPYITGDSAAPGLLELIADAVPRGIAEGLVRNDRCDVLDKKWLHVAPFLDLTTEKEDAQVGGFFLNTELHLSLDIAVDPTVLLHDAHRFRLFDGRLSADGEVLFAQGAGIGAETAIARLRAVLAREMDRPLRTVDQANTLAEQLYRESDERQSYRGDLVSSKPPYRFVQEKCTQRIMPIATPPFWAADDSVLVPAQDDPCYHFYSLVKTQTTTALQLHAATLGLSANEQAQVKALVEETEVRGGASVLRHFRCAMRDTCVDTGCSSVEKAGVCEYTLPAKRLNVLPDGVELVFLDDTKELANPVYPIWLHAFDAGGDAYRGLCGTPVQQTPGTTSRRAQAAVRRDHLRYECRVAQCVQASTDACFPLLETP